MNEKRESTTNGQEEQPVSAPQGNSLGIYVFGDRATDEILIPARELPSGKTASGAHDGQTRYKAEKYTAACGTDLLENLVLAYDGKNPKEHEESKEGWAVETVSEWKRVPDEDEAKPEHLYLWRQNGYMENKNSPVMVNTEGLKKARIAVVYNMVSEKFQDAPPTKKELKPLEIIKSLEKCKYSIIRARWGKSILLDALWKNTQAAKKAILIFNVDGLRQAGLNIRPGISWEQMVQETNRAVTGMMVKVNKHASKKLVDRCKAVVVCMKHEGCMLFYNRKVYLFYYCKEIEGDFIRKQEKTVFGSTSTMQAAVALGMAQYSSLDSDVSRQEENAISQSVETGLILMRELIKCGYGFRNCSSTPNPPKCVAYPYEDISDKFQSMFDFFSLVSRRNEESKERMSREEIKKSRPDRIFFRLNDTEEKEKITTRFLENGERRRKIKSIVSLCKQIVQDGATAAHVPYLKLRNLVTFDREEVEHIRSIQRIVEQYKGDSDRKTPLSICVFGRPGSGKSFAVKQIVKSLKVKDEDIFEFNLSQMAGVQDLYDAFHQIRDAGLRSDLPVAFFDEFDASMGNTKLGWLKYFLAPMQDGEFRENGVTHYIGKALFVFAGGTCQAMEELRKKQTESEMVQQKLPDFLSRIKGYIDVAGPNALPCPVADRPEDCWRKAGLLKKGEEDPELHIEDKDRTHIHSCPYAETCCQDESHYLRRAALLRSQLERKLKIEKADHHIEIDDRVLDAFLCVEQYKHGARSMDAIVQTSHVEPEQEFTVTSIDSNFLDLYATDDFKRYLRQPPKPDKQSN